MNQRTAVFHAGFREDLTYGVKADQKTALKLLKLIEAVMRDPRHGIGKPEPLKHLGSGYYSRRITQEHRLVYRVRSLAREAGEVEERIDFLQGRYHY